MTGAGSVVVRRQLGARLRELRVKAGKSIADVVEAGVGSTATIYRVEAGKVPVKITTTRTMCWLYGADSATTEALAALAPGTTAADWWEPYSSVVVPDWFGLYVSLEQTASRLRCFDPELVHGLLQTEDYARAVIKSEDTLTPDVVEQRVRFRIDRARRVLDNRPDLTVILGPAGLLRVIGSPEVMAAQLDHLRRLNHDGVATIRVLPWSAGAYPTRGSFDVLEFTSSDDPAVVYVEFSTGARYVEQPSQVAEYEHVFTVLMDRTESIEEWQQ